MELKPKIDEKLKKLEALRKKAKDQEQAHSMRVIIDQLLHQQNEYQIMEKTLRKKCDFFEGEYHKEFKRNEVVKDNVKQKRDILKTCI